MTAVQAGPELQAAREILARLIAFDSTSARTNRPIADWVSDQLASAGCFVQALPDSTGQKLNLIARRGTAGPGGLLLSGHFDTVPAIETDWNTDPFTLSEAGGRWFGRGVCDMKGFVALAIQQMVQADAALRCPLWLLLTCDEEIGSLGAQRFVRESAAHYELPQCALIGEPTGLRAVRMHKGHLKLRLIVRGRAAHSGLPHLGVNAIERAGLAIVALTGLAGHMRDERSPTSALFADCPGPVLNLGLISGGAAVNIVPDRCQIDLGVRLLPGQQSADALARIRTCLAGLPAAVRDDIELVVVNDSPPMLCDEHTPIHAELRRLLNQSESFGVSFASDAGILSTLGIHCVLWGPGDMENAHRANEFIDVEDFAAAGRRLAQIVARFCIEAESQER